jgi:pimeloyl-ACP methyl ester carboxylesterase
MQSKVLFRDIPISYSDNGSGRALVLLHGFPESKEIWNDTVKLLQKNIRVITIDLPGFGATPSIGYEHSMELMAESVKAVLDKLHLRKYVIVGHSMGGYVALAFAELFKKNVSGLVLFHSTPLADTEDKKRDRTRAIELVKQNSRHYVHELIGKLMAPGNEKIFKEELSSLKALAGKTSPTGIINALYGMRERKERTQLIKNSTFPVLFIIGKKDTVLPSQQLISIANECRNASVLILENAGHLGFIERKQDCAKGLLRFARMCFRR